MTPTALALLLTWAAAPAAAPASDPLARFGWLRDLVGACWAGQHPDGRPADTQCYQAQYDRFLRGTITIGGERGGQAGSAIHGDSVFAWSEKRGRVVYTTWSSDGGYATGEVLREAEHILFPDAPREGKPETRNRWSRTGPDGFEVVRERKDGLRWTELLRVSYRRVGA